MRIAPLTSAVSTPRAGVAVLVYARSHVSRVGLGGGVVLGLVSGQAMARVLLMQGVVVGLMEVGHALRVGSATILVLGRPVRALPAPGFVLIAS